MRLSQHSPSAMMRLLLAVCYLTAKSTALSKSDFPARISLRAAVLTAEPFAMLDEESGVYSGFQPDLLESIQAFAAEDGVDFNIILEEAPLYAYVPMLDRLSDNCNTTENPQPLEECKRYDMLIGDYYTNPDRSLRVDFIPPFLRTAVSAMKYVYREIGPGNVDVTTMEEASQANATICVVTGSYIDDVVMEQYPNVPYYRCETQDDCVSQLKDSQCVLFVDDELQLRHRTVDDPTLQVTHEHFHSQYIVWPLRSDLDPVVSKLVKRWIYAAKSNATMDELYDKYFSVNLCPLGKAGPKCDEPCRSSHGRSDRLGNCVCESTKWTGLDCSEEVMEDTNGIPDTLILIGYIMVGINFMATFICFVWLWVFRYSPQVQASQPFFLCLVLVGCLISTSTILALSRENTDGEDDVNTACMLIPWTYSVGFSITFGTLFAKIRRVYILFTASVDMRRVRISVVETISIIGGVLLLDVAVLTAWTIVDPLTWSRTILTTDQYGDPLSSEGHCTSDHWPVFAGIIACLHLGLLGFASVLCWMSRSIPTKFSEGKYASIAMISNLQIFIVGLPILMILGADPKSSFFVRSVIIWMNDLVIVVMIFGNLMYSYWKDRHIDSKQALRSAMQQYSRASRNTPNQASSPHSSPNSYLSGLDSNRTMELVETGECAPQAQLEHNSIAPERDVQTKTDWKKPPEPMAAHERPQDSLAMPNTMPSSSNGDSDSSVHDWEA